MSNTQTTTQTPAAESALGIETATVEASTHDLAPDEREAILWFHRHACERHLSREDAAAAIGRNWNTLYQVFVGSHGASKKNITADIRRYREKADFTGPRFVETDVARRVFQIFNSAWRYNSIVFIVGASQSGKTTLAREYARQRTDAGEKVAYVSMPSGGRMTEFVRALARTLGIERKRHSIADLKELCAEALDARWLLLVDECHQPFLRASRRPDSAAHIEPFEFLRNEIYRDGAGASLALLGTSVFAKSMNDDATAGWLEQMRQRRVSVLNLREKPGPRELAAFAKGYGLPPAPADAEKLQGHIIATQSLGAWLKLLRLGAGAALRANQTFGWGHVLAVHQFRQKLETEASE